jgi:hypothetical protein
MQCSPTTPGLLMLSDAQTGLLEVDCECRDLGAHDVYGGTSQTNDALGCGLARSP